MKKLATLLMTLMLMSTALWAEETVTVSANSSDISEGLDLKVVAKLFAEAKNLEEFENQLNNPDSAFCNLDLNGDGQVDYLRVVETGEGNKRLIVLQAILAKDIYQDVASIYVEKDETTNDVSVQVVGDEYVYGTNYIIEPVYVYRPLIYDWFWGPSWYAWHSPWYWGYYPGWWHSHSCLAHDWYWRRCYAWHHHHHWCSFRPGRHIHHGYHDLHHGVSRRDYAVAHPNHSFSQRNNGMTNAREIRNAAEASHRRSFTADGGQRGGVARTATASSRSPQDSRTFGSRTTAATRSASTAQRSEASAQRGTAATAQRSSTSTQRSTTATAQRSSSTTQRSSTATAQRSQGSATRSSQASATRTSGTTAQRSIGSSQSQRSSGSSSYSGSRSSSSSSSRSSGSYSGGSRSSGGYSGGSSRSGGGGYSGGSSRSGGGGGGGSRGGGGSTRR